MVKKYGTVFVLVSIILAFLLSNLNLIPGFAVYANEQALKLQMYNSHRQDYSNTISPRIRITNIGSSSIKLSEVEIKYYYTIDNDVEQNFWCDWSNKASSMVYGTFVQLSNPKETADYCLNINFREEAGLLMPNESVELHLRIAKTDWSDYKQLNDYSFNQSSSNYIDWVNVPVYLNGRIVWGQDNINESETQPVLPTDSEPPTTSAEPTTEITISAYMYNSTTKETSNIINPRFMLCNTGTAPINLEKVKIRYFYTINKEKSQNFWCDWSSAGTNNINGTLIKMSDAMIGADYYLELGFKTGTGELQPGQSVEIHTRIAKSDWTDYIQTDDFSFNSTSKKYEEWDKISVYYDNFCIFGTEPGIIAPKPEPIRSVELKICNSNNKENTNTIFARYILKNTGNIPVNLKDVKVRYFYTIDGEKSQNFWCDWSHVGKENVTGKFVKLNEPTDLMDYYIEVGFTGSAGILEPGDEIEIHTRVAKSDWSDYYQNNDYSFSGSKNNYIVWNKAALIIDGDMSWGDSNLLDRTLITDISASETTLIVSWLPVFGATGYEVECNNQLVGTTTGLTFEHTGLSSGTLYRYKVRPISSTMQGRWCEPSEKWTLPHAPLDTSLTASETEIKVEWEQVRGATAYDIEIDGIIIEDVESPYIHADLLPGTVHIYRIRAKNSSGPGEWTKTLVKWTIPDIVQNINFFATQNEIYMAWDYVEGADSYEIETNGKNIFSDGLEAVSENLLPGSEYSFRIRAINESGYGKWSENYNIWTLPDTVSYIDSESTEINITVLWEDVIGATGYDIEVDGEVFENQTSPFVHQNLGFGTSHIYRIRAKNSSGCGFWSTPFIVWTLPGLVEGLEAQPFQNEIILLWNPVNGATEYDIEIDGVVVESVNFPYIHTGIDAGRLYEYRVRARNSSGVGVWSDSISVWTIPDNDFIVSLNATQETIRIEWQDMIGATGYDIEIDGLLIEDTTSPFIHENLHEGTQHTYRLRAKNSSGIGLWSNNITGWTLPGIPKNINLIAGGTYLVTSWDEVEGATVYDIEINGEIFEDVLFPFTKTGLEHGKEYSVRVRAKNDSGFGFWSEKEFIWTIPGVVENVNVNAAQTWIELAWEHVVGATGYDIELNGNIIKNVVSPYWFYDLEMGTKYIIKIRAINSSGEGEWSNDYEKWTLPGIPENITAQSEPNFINIIWDEVTGATGYDIEVYGAPVDTGGLTTYVHYGLNANTQYTYRVRAKNNSGVGEWSSYIAKSTLTGKPEYIYTESDDTQIQISWEAVSGANYYDIEVDGEVITGLVDNKYIHTELLPYTLHTYRIRSGNDDGTSDWSNLFTCRTRFSAPLNINAVSTCNEIKVSWNAVEGASGYDIEVDGVLIDNGSNTSFIHTEIEPNTGHVYRVRAKNGDITGLWSGENVKYTLLPAPDGIETSLSGSYVLVKWNMVAGASAYDIEVDGEVIQTGLCTSYLHEDLEPYSTHIYRIRTRNREGFGEWSYPTEVRTLLSTPIIISTVSSSSEITIKWEEVLNASEYELMINGDITNLGEENTFNHQGLGSNSVYVYRIRAKNGNLRSEWSDPVTVCTLVATPANMESVISSRSIALTWDEVTGADKYEVEFDEEVVETDNNWIIFEELNPNSIYSIRIRAGNEFGYSEWSDYLEYVTPPDIPILKVKVTTRDITLSWDAVDGAFSYDIEIDGELIEDITETNYLHSNLKPNSRHYYRIRSKSESTTGEWSQIISPVTSPEILIPVRKDVIFNFVMIVPPKTGPGNRIITVTYDPEQLEVFDLCAVTPVAETGSGVIEGTSIEVIEYTRGRIVYSIGNVNNTVVNIIKFLSVKNGQANVSYTIE